jgi:uncharacterized protein YecT (DUF1311 family)
MGGLVPFIATVAVGFALSSTSVSAQQPRAPEQGSEPYSAAFAACMDAAGGVTSAMLNCTADEHRRLDELLNESYSKVMAVADSDQKEALRSAQRAWITYRDTSCSVMEAFAVGSMGPVLSSSCLLSVTNERLKYLRTLEALL